MFPFKPGNIIRCVPERKNMNRDYSLTMGAGLHRQDVELPDFRVGDWDAADGDTIPVNEDVSSGIPLVSQDPVRGIGIIDSQGEMKIAGGIKPVNMIKSFGNLEVPLFPLGTQYTAGGTEGIINEMPIH